MTIGDRPASTPEPRNRAERRSAAKGDRRRKAVAVATGASLVATGFNVFTASSASASTFSVTTGADSGAGSLRQAILDANGHAGADTITFDTTLIGGPIVLTSGQISVTDELTIQGPGRSLQTVTVDSTTHNGGNRLFYLTNSASSVVISGLTMTGATANSGAAIWAKYTDLTLQDVSLSGNSATAAGGALHFEDDGSSDVLAITDSVLTGNTAQNNGGALSMSGGTASISDTDFDGNQSHRFGGAIDVASGQLSVQGGTITDNHAPTRSGGGIHASRSGDDVTLVGVTIDGNTAASGGALSINSYGSIDIRSSTFSSNGAITGDGGAIVVGGHGAYARTIMDSTFSGNTADGSGGALFAYGVELTVSQTTLSGNSAAGDGGAIYLEDGELALEASTLTGNAAGGVGDAVAASSGTYRYGAHDSGYPNYYPYAYSVEHFTSSIVVSGSIIDGEVAAHDVVVNNYGATGGAYEPATISATHSLIGDVGNTAITTAGGNLIGVDPLLGSLSDNGGPTETHLPASSSPVKDAGDPAFSGAATDQRGSTRVVGGRVDMGSVEIQAPPVTTTTTAPPVFVPAPTTTTTAPPTSAPPTTAPPTTTPPNDAPPAPPSVPSGGGSSPVFVNEDGEVKQVPLPKGAPPNQVTAALALSPTESIAVTGDGHVFTTNPNDNLGGIPAGKKLKGPIVGLGIHWTHKPKVAAYAAAVEDEWEPTGYWLLGADGGVFAFGTAQFHGSTGARKLNAPIVGLTPTPSGEGYWLVASDGGVFSFGDARFLGSTGGRKLAKPIVSMVPTSTGKGYLLIAADGGVFTYGDAVFFGSGAKTGQTFVGAILSETGKGYWLLTKDGKRIAFGDAK